MSHPRTALPVIILSVALDGDEPDEMVWAVQCPHCQALDAFREIDRAVRWNTTNGFKVHDGRITSVTWLLGQTNFDHFRYECENCDGHVLMDIKNSAYEA